MLDSGVLMITFDDDYCFYTALFSALEQTHCARMWFYMSDLLFIARFWISTKVVYLQRCLVVTWLVPRETAAVSARSVYTIQPCTMSRHFRQSDIRGMCRKRRSAWHIEAWDQRRYLGDCRNCYGSIYNYCTEAWTSCIPFSSGSFCSCDCLVTSLICK